MALLKTRLVKLLFSYDWEVIEIQGAVFKMAWGVWLLLPFRTFRMVQGYNAVSNENYWGWGLFILGVIHFIAIAQGNIRWRRWITFIAFVFWVFTVVLIARQLHTSAIIPMFSVIAFFMGINFMRLGLAQHSGNSSERVHDDGPPEGVAERRHP